MYTEKLGIIEFFFNKSVLTLQYQRVSINESVSTSQYQGVSINESVYQCVNWFLAHQDAIFTEDIVVNRFRSSKIFRNRIDPGQYQPNI